MMSMFTLMRLSTFSFLLLIFSTAIPHNAHAAPDLDANDLNEENKIKPDYGLQPPQPHPFPYPHPPPQPHPLPRPQPPQSPPPYPLPLITFDTSPRTTYKFVLQNDPVMGGKSHSSYDITNDFFEWDGEVVDVPFLQAPGFCSVKTIYQFIHTMNDASGFTHLKLRVRSSTPKYKGFKVSFASRYNHNPTFKSFKANFAVEASNDWQWVDIPFDDFSNDWSPYTGDQVTKCKDDPKVCPKEKNLSAITQLTLWAEGVSGVFNLDVLGIYAGFAEGTTALSFPTETTCTGDIQPNLRFSVSSFTAESVRLSFDPPEDESLAEAICCDPIYTGYAEPRGFFEWGEVSFFDKLDPDSPNTFYDPVCGIPLFVAPRGRTFDDFRDDTIEHGWPSFRQQEMVDGNLYIADDGRTVLSACGTRLGTYEPDSKGPRYCLDVSCVAGNPVEKNRASVSYLRLAKKVFIPLPGYFH